MKDIKGNKILHLIDLFSKYSVAVRVPNKESSTIINTIFKYWVAYFGCPSYERKSRGRKLADEMGRGKKFPWYTHRLTHRKRVTCELHDSYFRWMTINHAIPRSSGR